MKVDALPHSLLDGLARHSSIASSQISSPVSHSDAMMTMTQKVSDHQPHQQQQRQQHPQNGPRVAVIGFGPGGMFFCHALETRRRELEINGDLEALAKLPTVCAFEKASTHGGLWRDVAENNNNNNNINNINNNNNNTYKTAELMATSLSPASSSSSDSQEEEEEDENTTTNPNNADNDIDGNNNDTDNGKSGKGTGMYDALWMNCVKERNEFFDYTFEEHFGVGVSLPPYLPRHVMLDYMTKRVTKHCPDFFEKYAVFNTEVSKVTFDSTKQTFQVTTRNGITGEVNTSEHDKCIWAGGEQGSAFIPSKLRRIFLGDGDADDDGDSESDSDSDDETTESDDDDDDDSDDQEESPSDGQKEESSTNTNVATPSPLPFQGRVVHSAYAGATLKEDVQGKKVLLIGGSYSAEDLALMAIKLGAEKVYISYRDCQAVVTWQYTWPRNKVELINKQIPVGISEGGTCIQFSEFDPMTYKPTEGIATELRGIDTVIFCTGYRWNFDMLHESVAGEGAEEEWNDWVKYKEGPQIEISKDWKMPENRYTSLLGEVEVADELILETQELDVYLYRGYDINNPSMMYLFPAVLAQPFSAMGMADIAAWHFFEHLSGSTPLPPPEVMRQRRRERIEYALTLPTLRLWMDKNYQQAYLDYKGSFKYDFEVEDWAEEQRYVFHVVAELMQEAKYPVNIGTFDELNELGERLIVMCNLREYGSPKYELCNKTFRDFDAGLCDQIVSTFSGCKPRPFNKPWLELDDFADIKDLVDK